MKKKILTLAIGLALTFTSTSFAFADETTSTNLSANPINTADTAADESVEVVDNAKTEIAIENIKPVLTKVTSVRYDRLKLVWEATDGVTGYKIYRATSKNGKYKAVATVKGSDKTTYTDTKRTCGKTYYYKIRAYKVSGGKNQYSKYSAVLSAKSVPSKTTITDAWDKATYVKTYVEWKGVAGATDYQLQYRTTEDGKTSAWKSKTESVEDTYTFKTYNQLLAEAKKENPSGYVTGLIKDGSPKIPIKEYVEKRLKKNQAYIDELTRSKFATMFDDETREFVESGGKLDIPETTYEFRVRAYRTVNGKKIYGAWSEPYTMVETIDIDKVYEELRAIAIEYAAKNNPNFAYNDEMAAYIDDTMGNYKVDGDWGYFSIYAKTDEVIESFRDNVERYIHRRKGGSNACIYIKKVHPGDTEGMLGAVRNESIYTYYRIWMFY